jgi:hypothetical protein
LHPAQQRLQYADSGNFKDFLQHEGVTMNTHERRPLGLPLALTRPKDLLGLDAPVLNDEELILDDRSEKRPAQIVEDKLSGMLKGRCVKVSQLRHRSTIAARS